MANVPCTCEVAGKLSAVEQRLRDKAKLASSEFAMAGYAQASLEIAREGLAHYRSCLICQAVEAARSAERRAA